jgi:hypothetical protein
VAHPVAPQLKQFEVVFHLHKKVGNTLTTIAYMLVKASFSRVHSWLEFYFVFYEYVISPANSVDLKLSSSIVSVLI